MNSVALRTYAPMGVLALAVLMLSMGMLMTYIGISYDALAWTVVTIIVGIVGLAWSYKTWVRLDNEELERIWRQAYREGAAAERKIMMGEY